MVNVDDDSLQADLQPCSVGLIWVLVVARSRFCIHQMRAVLAMAMPRWQHHGIGIYLCQGGYVIVVVCLSVCLYVCLFVCLLATLRKNFQTDLHEFSGKSGNGPVNKRLYFGGDLVHCLHTGIVFRIRHYWEMRKVVNGHKSVAHLIR